MTFKSIQEVNTFLNSIPKFSDEGSSAADFSLDRFERFCASMGQPQDQFPSIHVAGSNGKGSTCGFIASIYRHVGYKTGLYTSPHLMDVRERFKINGEQIGEKELVHFFQKYASRLQSFRLTYFEITTAIAFWWFARENIDIGVIEVGLGGRLDATNVITPLVSVITSITLDHADILGDTIEAIAAEKAGIIKKGVPVVVGKLPTPALKVIKQKASKNGSAVKTINRLKPRFESGTFSVNIAKNKSSINVSFHAPVQAYNAAMAWYVCYLLQSKLSVDQQEMIEGIQKTDHRGRFEKMHAQYRWYFDGAHNAEALRTVKEAINTVGRVDEAVLVLSLMNDKINKKLVKELLEFKKIFYYTPTTERGADFEQVNRWLPHISPFPADQDCRHNLLGEFKNELVIFGGSFYFYPRVKKWIASYI